MRAVMTSDRSPILLLCRLALVAVLALLASSAVGQAPAGSHHYIVVGKGANDPTLPAGATVLEKWGRRQVVLLPDGSMEALRSDPAVRYLQLLVDPATVANETEALSRSLRPAETSWPATSWASGAYQYDGSGNIRAVGADQFAYDQVGRLTQANVNSKAYGYAYDHLGNRVRMTRPGDVALPAPVLPEGSNRLRDATYDVAGNVIALAGIDYTYDALNSMTTVRDNGERRVALYTASGERLALCDPGLCTWTLRGADQKPLRVFESGTVLNGATPHNFLWVEDYAYRGGTLLGAARETAEGGYLLFHPDHLGTPRVLTSTSATGTDARGMVQHHYEPFGLEQTSIQQESVLRHDRTEPLQYTGHERDYLGGTLTENADYVDYMHARYYRAASGRFLSVDPGGYTPSRPQSWNRYAYVENNPINRTDPNGQECLGCQAQDRDIRELAAGRMSVSEYNNRLTARGVGATIGGAVVLTGVALRAVWDLFTAPDIGPEVAPSTSGPPASRPTSPRVKKMTPDPEAVGPNTSFKRSGETDRVSGYETYDANGNPVLRFRGEGRSHGGVEPPVILEPKPGKGPGAKPIVPRVPKEDELPNGYAPIKKGP
jgi:RHS repeat-associated protein